ncbi:MAG: type II toxin-antitoxin system VapC family toxin [Candidatus Thorarchaeota archaeon]|nr:type II toxin-antitoxin system VapC family toxin [Candidatus Thorarchaeota archaeon]
MIADSSFIIDIMRKSKDALAKLEALSRDGTTQYLTTPTVMEIAVGISLAQLPEKEQNRIDTIIGDFQVLPLDAISAWRAGIELGRLRKEGLLVDPIDAQIAGIALQHNEMVVTRNQRHFERFEGLHVESY